MEQKSEYNIFFHVFGLMFLFLHSYQSLTLNIERKNKTYMKTVLSLIELHDS